MDGDDEFPTICGTGSEVYVGLSYDMRAATFCYLGCSLRFTSQRKFQANMFPAGEKVEMQREFVSIYRWHLSDPIYWQESCRITVQQMAVGSTNATTTGRRPPSGMSRFRAIRCLRCQRFTNGLPTWLEPQYPADSGSSAVPEANADLANGLDWHPARR